MIGGRAKRHNFFWRWLTERENNRKGVKMWCVYFILFMTCDMRLVHGTKILKDLKIKIKEFQRYAIRLNWNSKVLWKWKEALKNVQRQSRISETFSLLKDKAHNFQIWELQIDCY